MKTITFLAVVASVPLLAQSTAEPYELGPDSERRQGVPRGEVSRHVWESEVFPGTVREYSLYVPEQYDGERAACVMVFQDGHAYVSETGQFRVPIVFDNLIHRGEMPITIGIFINPGHHAKASATGGDRFPENRWRSSNRSFEYDRLSDQYSRFLLEEILPAVGEKYKLRTDPRGRAICGISSGGICAFTAAWERPEEFHKVLSHVGSFTNIRGGHNYPAIIRKTKPAKPIRVFLQGGEKDLNNSHGNWWLANLQMESALRFAGYETKFVGGVGGHNGIHGGAILPDSLRWLWRDEVATVPAAAARLSPEKLAGIDPAVEALIDEGRYKGAITVVARGGKIAHFRAFGDLRSDSILRIYSMTKPIVSVAVMMLVEAGKVAIDDPVANYLPEFARVRVFESGERVSPRRPPTVRDLLRHTAGLTYGSFSDSPVDKLYREADLLRRDHTIESMVSELCELPLLYHPGERWHYSVSVDVLGAVVEAASGEALDGFLRTRIFEPLGMRDTGFAVSEAQRSRFATNYGPEHDGSGLRVIDDPAQSRYLTTPKFLSGGGGLVSTADDYLKFALVLAGGGEWGGVRLLETATVAEMTRNQLSESLLPIAIGSPRPGTGFGLGVSVRVAEEPRARRGEYGWGGLASTQFWVSPETGLVVLTLAQHIPYTDTIQRRVLPIVYDAVAEN